MTETREPGAPRADPDRPCLHRDFVAAVDVHRLYSGEESGPPDGYSADIKIKCAACDEPFRFVGVQAGLRPDRPMCSVDETELRAPIRPASADPDFGLGIPGFAVLWRADAAAGPGGSERTECWRGDGDG